MERGKKVVVDASVAVKWFNLEEYSDLADKLKDMHVKGKVILTAPVLILFEVANALRYNPDFGVEDIKNSVNDLLDLQITLFPPGYELMEVATELAYTHGVTIYDACYIALAKLLKTTVYTADEKLTRRVNEPYLRHISEIEPKLR